MVARREILNTEQVERLAFLKPSRAGMEQLADSHELLRADRDALAEALRAIEGGNLGDKPWQANYERLREYARAALAVHGSGGEPGV